MRTGLFGKIDCEGNWLFLERLVFKTLPFDQRRCWLLGSPQVAAAEEKANEVFAKLAEYQDAI